MRRITNISAGVDEHLCNNKEIILGAAKQLEEKNMVPILNKLKFIDSNLQIMSQQKEEHALKDKGLAAQLINVLRDEEKESKKREVIAKKEAEMQRIREEAEAKLAAERKEQAE